MIFVNLPVADLPAAMTFYLALGFINNPNFSDARAACMVWSETINVMLLTHTKWQGFTRRPIPPISWLSRVMGFSPLQAMPTPPTRDRRRIGVSMQESYRYALSP